MSIFRAAIAGLAFSSVVPVAAHAQTVAAPLRVDATASMPPAEAADYTAGSSTTPGGETLGVTDRYLTLDGKPWVPVMGELHYARLPEAEWEDAILQMKAAGVSVISTYVIWIQHEEVKGEWDWSGQRDLRKFAQLCAKHGMLLYPRIGPWAHAEARNGGLPDWVMASGPVRQLDPAFMAETDSLYQQIAGQLKGLLWKDGGPVIGVQLDNEYAMRGPGRGADYILALKQLAVSRGLDVPLYTVTGWDNAVVPAHAVLPVYGGYPDAPWGASRDVLPPQEVYAFRFGSRVTGSMGMIGAGAAPTGAVNSSAPAARTPFLTAEMGGGAEDTYHRRPVIADDDVAAMMPVMLGSGVNGYGMYMFHGGQNPAGKVTTLQESQQTHYPTDVPVKSYDFQAPIGEYGLERQSLRRIKQWNYFLRDFGAELAPMPAYPPEHIPSSPTDLSLLRWSVRTDGHAGFLFVNNYIRQAAMPARPGTQFAVALPGGRTLLIPQTPVEVPSGAYFAWPFGLDLGGVQLRYGTAQLVAKMSGDKAQPDGDTYVFACVQAVRCELAFAGSDASIAAPPAWHVERSSTATVVTKSTRVNTGSDTGSGAPGANEVLTVQTAAGKPVHFLLLSPEQAQNSWVLGFAGGKRLVETEADVFADESAVTLRQLGDPQFRFALYPQSGAAPRAGVAVTPSGGGAYAARVNPVEASIKATPLRPAAAVPPVGLGPALSWRPVGVAQAPDDAVWKADAAQWSLHLPATLPSGVSNFFLRVQYAGDGARLVSGDALLDDDFFNGEPWLIGLDRYRTAGRLPPLALDVLPMRADSPVYLPAAARAQIGSAGQTATLDTITLVPQYTLQLTGLLAAESTHP